MSLQKYLLTLAMIHRVVRQGSVFGHVWLLGDYTMFVYKHKFHHLLSFMFLHTADIVAHIMLATNSRTARSLSDWPCHDPVAYLPRELAVYIFKYLDASTLVRASLVAKAWTRLCKDPPLWRELLTDEPSIAYGIELPQRSDLTRGTIDWYELYKQCTRIHQNWHTGRFARFQLPGPAYGLEGHTGAVYALQVSGYFLVSGGMDHSIRIWDLRTHRLVGKPLLKHQSEVLCLRFNPRRHSDIIISGGANGELIASKFSRRTMIKAIVKAHADGILSVKFDDNIVITGSADQTIKIWTLASVTGADGSDRWPNQPFRTLVGHDGGVNCIDFLGDRLVSGSGDNTVRLWSISQGTCIMIEKEPRSISCVQFNGDTIVCGGKTRCLTLYNDHLEPLEHSLPGHSDVIRAVRCRGRGGITDTMVSGSYDGSIILWTKKNIGKWDCLSLCLNADSERSLKPQGTSYSKRIAPMQLNMTEVPGAYAFRRSSATERTPPKIRCHGSVQSTRPMRRQLANMECIAHEHCRLNCGAADVRLAPHQDPRLLNIRPPRVLGVDFDGRRIACCSESSTIHVWDAADDDTGILDVVGKFEAQQQ